MNMKNVFLMLVVLLLAIATVGSATAIPATIEWLKIDGDVVSTTAAETLHVERGDVIPVRIKIKALENVNDVDAFVRLAGYKYADQELDAVYDQEYINQLDANSTETINLEVRIPTKMDVHHYDLRVRVETSTGTVEDVTYTLNVKGIAEENAIQIKDYTFSPSQTTSPGKAVGGRVQVKNLGIDELNDVKVTISIPALDVSAYEYMDTIDADDTETFEQLLLRIPSNAEPGVYTAVITVEFDEYYSTTQTTEFNVICVSNTGACGSNVAQEESETRVSVPVSMDYTANGAAFPITITNNGNNDAAYTLNVQGINWATFRFDPTSSVIVPAHSTSTVYLYVDAAENVEAGEKYFKLQVTSGTETNEVALSVNVLESNNNNNTNLRSALEIGLIILVVILIIIGLIIGFSKLKDNSNKDEEEAETYY
jgi:uncharacterized membrane protein